MAQGAKQRKSVTNAQIHIPRDHRYLSRTQHARLRTHLCLIPSSTPLSNRGYRSSLTTTGCWSARSACGIVLCLCSNGA